MVGDEYYKCLFDNAFEPILLIDGHYFIDGNNAALKILGMTSKDELRVVHPKQLSPKYQPDGQLSEQKATEMINICYEKGYHQFEWQHKTLEGVGFLVEVTLKLIVVGSRELMHTSWRELDAEKALYENINKKNRLLAEKNKVIGEVKNILDSNDDAGLLEKLNLLEEYKYVLDESCIVLKADTCGRITYVNEKFCEISGYGKDELISKNHEIVLHPDAIEEFGGQVWADINHKKLFRGVLKCLTKEGKTYYADSTIIPLLNQNEDIIEYISIRHDITQIYEKEALILEQMTDRLTGLPNRIMLLKDIERSVDPKLAVFNIDRFKDVNESYSLEVGDDLLREFSLRLKKYESVNLRVYRVNGDLFALLASGYVTMTELIDKCLAFIGDIEAEVLRIDDIFLEVSVTAGIAKGKDKTLTHAEMAHLYAKRNNQMYALFDKDLPIYRELLESIEVTKDIKVALKRDNVLAYGQRVVSNDGGEDKYETLMRLRLESGEVMSPFKFLSQAKKAKLYPELSRCMIEKSCNFFAGKDKKFAINLMIEDIKNKKTIKFLFDSLKRTGTAQNVTLEIVESEGIEKYSEVEAFIAEAKQLGCRIAIDDFGTGYSNFEYIIRLNVDVLKIDGSLIKNIHIDKNTYLTVKTIVSFAKVLDVKVVAEFVHCREVQEIVESLDIDYSQGYLFHEPQELGLIKGL